MLADKKLKTGLDLMTPEPLPANNPLLKLPNCVIPHLGTQTLKTTMEMGMVAANNILNALDGKPMISQFINIFMIYYIKHLFPN
ncbi:glyoxylate reductase/hydroxypyruvate reductase-like isoform 2-T2 [Cochliomyia hominivorax]